MKTAGYAREAAGTGTLRRQTERIRTVYGTDIPVFYDSACSHMQRDLMIDSLNTGDLLIMCEIGCLSDEAEECYRIWKQLFEKNIRIVFLREGYLDTDLFRNALKSGKKDHIDLLERIVHKQIGVLHNGASETKHDRSARAKAGAQNARKAGRALGRKKGSRSESEKEKNAKKVIREKARQFGGELSDAQLMKELSVSRRTYYRYKKEIHRSPES